MTPTVTVEVTTFCRICPTYCGLLLTLDKGRVVSASGDRDHPATHGFCCRKGRSIGALHERADRFLTAQRGNRRGGFVPMDTDQALDEVGAQLVALREEHGPDSIALFMGTQAYQATPTIPVVRAWLRALGTRKFFRTMSIDQSAKDIAAGRLGRWAAGPQRFDESDVWMYFGLNPLVSMQGGGTGFPVHRGRRAVREARAAGLKLIVVDPRVTETARESDLHLRLRPGTDALLVAAMLHVILEEGLADAEFCAQHVQGVEDLRCALRGGTPASVADDVGVDADLIVRAARLFGSARRGMATSGTGPDMGPWSNLSEHLIQSLNVVCGRFPRAGERQAGFATLAPDRSPRAEVVGPSRPWESGYRSRLGFGLLSGDLPTASLPSEILEPGDDRVRALVVIGGNPASAIPGQATVVEALGSLELLVTVDPFPTETARLADYVIAPRMILERPDSTRALDDWYEQPFAQHTRAVLEPAPGTLEDWEVFAELADRMEMPLTIGGLTVTDGESRTTTDEILDHLSRHGKVAPEELRRHPHGRVYDEAERPLVHPASDGRGRFDLLPADVALELQAALRRERIPVVRSGEVLLAVRRSIEVMNSVGRGVPGMSSRRDNPCHVHPEDLARFGIVEGDRIQVSSAHGGVTADAVADPSLRQGTVTLAHCFGVLPGETGRDDEGVNPGLLLSLEAPHEAINAMPTMTGVVVRLQRAVST